MTDADPIPEPRTELDPEAEQERLDDLGERIDRTRHEVERDLSDRDSLGHWMPDSGPQDAPTEEPEDRPDL